MHTLKKRELPSNILRYVLLLLGGAVGAHGQLTLASPAGAWLPGGERLGTRTLNGAAATLEIGVLAGDETLYQPCGRFIVSRIESGEGQDSVTLSGYDEMVHALAAPFTDGLTYPQPLSAVLAHILAQCDLPYDTLPDCNGAVSIPARPDWGEGCTLRRALGMAAGAMGCFARVTPQGRIRLQSVWPASFRALAAGKCLSMSLSSLDFALNRVRAVNSGNEETPLAEAALNAALPAGASNTLELRDNALLRAGSAQSLTSGLLAALSGMTVTPFEADIPGDPTLEIGRRLRITDLRGAAHDSYVFARTLSFGQDFTVSLSCDPDTSGVSLPRALAGSGLLSSAALGDGVVTARNYESGDLFSAQPILHIMQIDPLKVIANISEQYFPNVKVGMPVELKVDIFPDQTFTGTVSLIYPALDPTTRTFKVEVKVPNARRTLRPGMYARTIFNMGHKEGVMVPDVAVQKQVGTAERFVYVIEGDSVARRRRVDVGRQVGDRVDILSGVGADEAVAVTALSKLYDGAKVEIKQE